MKILLTIAMVVLMTSFASARGFMMGVGPSSGAAPVCAGVVDLSTGCPQPMLGVS